MIYDFLYINIINYSMLMLTYMSLQLIEYMALRMAVCLFFISNTYNTVNAVI